MNIRIGEYKDWWIINDLENFRNRPHKDCVKKTFPGIEKSGTQEKTGLDQLTGYKKYEDPNKDQLNKDSNFSFSKDKDSNGCLTVVWDRSEPKQKTGDNKDKFSGKFALLWSFSQGDKGFISHSRFNFDSTGNEKSWASGLIYALEKYETDKWKIAAQYETWTEDNNVFPNPGGVLNEIKELDFWGLEGNSKKDKSNLVKESEVGSTRDEREQKLGGSYWRWTGKNNVESKITDWSSNLKEWWEELFKNCKNKILDKVEGITGTWEKVAIEWDKKLGEGG